MYSSSNGAVADRPNGTSATLYATSGRRAPASVFLLGHIEHLSRQLGRADGVLEDLSDRAERLERRLAVLERDAPVEAVVAEERIEVALPVLEPPRFTAQAPPSGLVNLLSRLESLGQQVGRGESELDVAREEAEPMSAPVVEVPSVPAEPVLPVFEAVEPSERLVIEYPTVAPIVGRRIGDEDVAGTPAGDSHAAFAAETVAATGTLLRRIRPIPAPDDTGPPLQIPASEIFAPSEAHRAFPVRIDTAEEEQAPVVTVESRRRRRRTLLAAAVVIAVLIATLVGAAALTRTSDDDNSIQATSTSPATSAAATIPPADATLQPVTDGVARVPGIYAMIASATAGAGGSPTGLIGSTSDQVAALLGAPTQTQPDGVVVYLNGSALVTYSTDGRVLRAAFDFTTPGDELDQAGAQSVLALYRPADASETRRESPESGVERIIYSSPALEAAFAGADTAGRASGSYTEEIHSDSSTGQVSAIVLALGESP